jgi:hypothetical protein
MKPPLETSLAYKYFVAYRLYDGQRFDEVVIPYRPKHSYQKKLRSYLRSERQIQWLLRLFMILSVLAATANVFAVHHLPLPVFAAIALAAVGWVALEMHDSIKPTHFGLSAKGLRLYWIRWFGDNSSEYMPWNSISFVRLRRAKEFGLVEELWIDFVDHSGQSVFSLRVDGVVTGEQRKRLHTALKQHLSPAQIDPQLNDLLNPVKIDGYTQLWLEVLAASTNRIRQDTLPEHAVIANDRYEILGQIGSGGQCVAYIGKALPGALGPDSKPLDVVLKEFVLPYNGGLHVSKKALESIQREADLLRRLEHPQIVRLIDIFVEDQRAYMVLEHIEGESLRNLVARKGHLKEEEAIDLAMQMCEILSYLHNQKPAVLHRDFTPENLIMSTDGNLRLIDFNVAQEMHADATRTVVGKHSYIPPEQFRGKATPQSDIYALGASLFYLLTGRDPEPISAAHPSVVNELVSQRCDRVVAQATAPDCNMRFGSAQALKEALLNLKSQLTGSTPI